MRMSSEQRLWVFITRDKFFTTLPIMVFGQTSVGNSEFDVWHFFNRLFPHTLLFQGVYISVLLSPQSHLPMQGICQEMQVVKQTQP
jgi:hypothetical protein